MIATLISQSFQTGRTVTKSYILDKALSLKNVPQKITNLILKYEFTTNMCQITPVWDEKESREYHAVFALDLTDHDPFSEKTDKEMLEEFCERKHQIKIQTDEFYELGDMY